MGFENNLQLVLLAAGMGLLCWMMMRNRFRRKKTRYHMEEMVPLKLGKRPSGRPASFSGVASAGAHPDFLKWQVEFHDLARQMKAELDSKMVAVNKLTKEYDAAAVRLSHLIAEARRLGVCPQEEPGLGKGVNKSEFNPN